MIVPMKKIAVLVQEKDANPTLEILRNLGVVHVENTQVPHGEVVNKLLDDIALVDAVLSILSKEKFIKASGSIQQEVPQDWKFVVKHVVALHKRLEQLEEYSRLLKNRISEWQQWGDFDPDAIRSLAGKNIFIRLYQIPVKELDRVFGGVIIKNIFTSAGIAHCMAISRNNIELPFKEFVLPKLGLEKMRSRLYEDARMMEIIQDDICKYMAYRKNIEDIQKNLTKDLEFNEALSGMGKENTVAYLTGFVPVSEVAILKQEAQSERWGLMIREPSEEDNVPTLLKNPRWITLIKPVLNLLGILPGYRELDVSLLFLIFFSIFFGILIGDAGYGLSYLLLTIWFQKKRAASFKNNNVFLLFYLLSSCAIIWGVLTGTFFGQSWLSKRGIAPLIPALNDLVNMQTLCFFLGALHLSLAHSWRALLKFPSVSCLADIGWISVLWAAFFLARTLILGLPLPDFVSILAWSGIALVVFFSSPQRNIFKAIGNGLGSVSFGLNFMSTFTDVVSYVRLFAVGLAAVAIAETTNSMTASLGTGPLAVLGGVMIVVVGHALNIVLGPISVLVHGVRLNVLEFSGHASITWSGMVYKPLKS
jgi:V/A-type H+-transporting ATPase subunit I